MTTFKPPRYALALLFCTAAVAQTKSDEKADDSGVPKVFQTAIAELTAEMEAVIKDPVNGTRRVAGDYFLKSQETVDEATMLKVLSSRLHKDVRVDSYVKWQLLSIVKMPFSDENAKAAITLYRRAPLPPPRPGTGADGEMSSMAARLKQADVESANRQWEERLAAHDKLVGPILSYRDDFYGRLPRTNEAIRAGFVDAEQRGERGYNSRTFVTRLSGDLRSLAAGSKPVEINQLASLALNYANKPGGKSYNGLRYNDKAKKAEWVSASAGFDKKAMEKLATDLKEMTKAGF